MTQEQDFFINLLIKDLKSDDPEKVAKAEQSLLKINKDSVIEILVARLGDPSWKIRKKASEILGRIGSRALRELEKACWDENEDVRYWSIRTISVIGSVDSLIPILKHKEKDTRYYVVTELGAMESDRAVQALVQCLGDPSWSIRRQASDCLEAMGKRILPILKKAFTANLGPSGNDDISHWSIKIIARLLGPDAIESLCKAMKSDNKNLRFYAVTAITDSEGTSAIPPLIAALEDSSWIVRRQASEGLISFGETAIPYLKQAFKKGGADLKYWSIKIWSRLIGSRAAEEFIPILRSENEDMRYYALEALGEVMNEDLIPVVVERLADPSWIIRKLSAQILESMGPVIVPYVEHLLGNDNEDYRYWAVRLLGRMGDKGIGKLLEHLSESDKRTKQFIISVLGEIRERKVIEALITCLRDENWPVRNLACNTLVRFGSAVMEPLLDAIVTQRNDDLQFWGRKVLNAGIPFLKGALGRLMARSDGHRSYLMESFPELFEGEALDLLISGDETSFRKARKMILSDPGKYTAQVVKYLTPDASGETLTRLLGLAMELDSPEVTAAVRNLISSKPSEDVAMAGMEYLIAKGDRDSLPAISELADHASPLVRTEAINGLCTIGGRSSEGRLMELLPNESEGNQLQIIETMGPLSNPAYLETVLDLMDRQSDRVRAFAHDSIKGMIKTDPERVLMALRRAPAQLLADIMAVLRELGSADPTLAGELDSLAASVLSGDDPLRRMTVLDYYPGIPSGPCCSIIENIMISGHPEERRMVMERHSDYRGFSDSAFLVKILEILEPSDPRGDWVRRIILKLPTEELSDLRDKAGPRGRELVREVFAKVMGEDISKNSGNEVDPVLEGEIRATDSVISRGLSADEPGTHKTVEGLEKQLKLVKQLSETGKSGVDSLLNAFESADSTVQTHIIEALGKTGDPNVIEPLKKIAENSTWVITSAIIEVLAGFNPELTSEFLVSFLRDENPMVRKKVSRVLGEMKSHHIVEQVIDLIGRDDFMAMEDAWNVFKISGEVALRALAPHVSDKNITRRRRVSEFMAEEGPHVVKYLIETIADDNIFHRNECIKIVQRLGKGAISFLEEARQGKPTHVRRWVLQAMEAVEKHG
ncbi:MAG: hypothetical protein CVV64_09150 [Candidatus Wallbacteria bacterium HGW-Wallbacteria-1]|jgi:HEAT repeat protein|uniref:HEAT repeat domain-containing protein n=1 Tax=Candidatus Wallbacteria bacterium HGW-Wallbacteria-1 TaxID=2013854 RepID=A0A2N1PQA1_9BACT|nr:MAG: hypothetical protein CVV64_09150 [Candidatus Wallbacteria bacterium HGW-Wallbacteria-1]